MKMIQVTCAHCGATTHVASEYAGQTGPCATCKNPITVPTKPHISDFRPSRLGTVFRAAAYGLAGIAALGVLLTLFVLVFLAVFQPETIPFLPQTTPPIKCHDNLRKIGEAMQAYVKANGHYPPAYTVDKDGNPQHSWRVLLLPYLGEQRLFDQYDMQSAWNSPENQRVADRMPSVYACPDGIGGNDTNYMVINGPTLLFHKDRETDQSEILDLPSQTLLVIEVRNMDTNWLEPIDLDGRHMDWTINVNNGLGSHHGFPGTHALCVDGSVVYLRPETSPAELQAMATINDGQSLTP